MAATMSGTTFMNSTSSFRASQSHATPSYSYTDNPLTQLPSVDFNFEDLRQRMAAFTVKFDAFIEKGRKRVLEERNEFRGRLAELGGMYTYLFTLRIPKIWASFGM
jgi:kinetochore protein Spc25